MSNATAVKPNAQAKDHFLNLTPGKLMGLRQITDAKDRFKVLALDQSNSFKKAIRGRSQKAGKPAEPTYKEVKDTKIEMVRVLGAYSSAVLLDVNFGARESINSFALPRGAGLIVRSEASRDAGLPSEYEPGWSAEKIKKMGSAAVKLLVYLDTQDKQNVKAQMDFVERVSRECAQHDILLMTEELSFPRKGEEKSSPSYKARKAANIIEATRLIGPLTDILKLEFPANMGDDGPAQIQDNLGRLNEAAIRPWVLLSAGEKFDIFAKQVEWAMKAGASGYMAGRAIFNEYFDCLKPQEAAAFLAKTGVDRMQTLNRLVDAHADSWLKRCGLTPETLASAVGLGWHLDNGEKPAKGADPVRGDY